MVTQEPNTRKILYLSPNEVIGSVFDWYEKVDALVLKSVALPPNTICETVHFDYNRNAFAFILRNPAWPIVPAGEQLSAIELSFQQFERKFQRS